MPAPVSTKSAYQNGWIGKTYLSKAGGEQLKKMTDNVSAESLPLGGLLNHATARRPRGNQRVTNRR